MFFLNFSLDYGILNLSNEITRTKNAKLSFGNS